MSHNPLIATRQGPLRGTRAGDCLVFRGVPYAAPPVGALRFRPPVPHPAWTAARDALDFGPAAPQLPATDITESGSNVVAEDCLTLNVWAPAHATKPLPVMVWIHGGAFIEGSARNYWYDGTTLAGRGDVIVVTVQYRLGPFGFLELGEAGGDAEAGCGNAGLLDQVAALRWVQENIAAFGGDAGNVTLFGESAGGAAVAMLLGLPSARGLFHKAIVQSLSPQLGRPLAQARAVTRHFMRAARVATLEQLRALRCEDLLAAWLRLRESDGHEDREFSPTIDGAVLPDHAIERLRAGHGDGIPLIIGTTLDEFRFFTEIEDIGLLRKPAALFERQLLGVAGEDAPGIAAAYGLGGPAESEGRMFIAGDVVFRIPSIRIAETLGPRQDVWMYLFTYRSSATGKHYQSAHAMELPFLFGTLEDRGAVSFTGRTPGREHLAEAMQDAWTSFAHTGVPTSPGLPEWPRYDATTRATMDLNVVPQVVADPYAHHRRAWAGVPFDAVRPTQGTIETLLFVEED